MDRLQKVIAQAGVCSRRKAEELILTGRVKLNGAIVKEMGIKASKDDIIEVDGIPIYKENYVYYLFYKPRGVISAVKDDKNRKVVTDYFVQVPERVYPVGRLDYDTSGLLLLTNDGDFMQHLSHPKNEIDKVYVAKIEGIPTFNDLKKLEKGVIVDMKKTAPAKVVMLSSDKKSNTSIVQITIHEGRNHQVKNMFEVLGYTVTKLKREKYADLTLDGLRPGQYRELTNKEVFSLLS